MREDSPDLVGEDNEPAIRPVDADGVAAVALGTAAWAVAGLVLLVFFRDDLDANGSSWWLWVCAVGAGLGLLGLPYVLKRRAAYQRHDAERHAAYQRHDADDDGEESSL